MWFSLVKIINLQLRNNSTNTIIIIVNLMKMKPDYAVELFRNIPIGVIREDCLKRVVFEVQTIDLTFTLGQVTQSHSNLKQSHSNLKQSHSKSSKPWTNSLKVTQTLNKVTQTSNKVTQTSNEVTQTLKKVTQTSYNANKTWNKANQGGFDLFIFSFGHIIYKCTV
jgi:hypothetical protein